MKNLHQDLSRQFRQFERSTKDKLKNLYLDFPKYSTDFLQQLNTHSLQEPGAFGKLISSIKWPAQQFNSGHFADLSFTLFRNDRYLLDLYVWHHQDTNIHDHHFSGAFKIVQGESFHLTYEYQSEKKIYPWLDKGKLGLLEKRNLREGDTRTIGFSNRFIHQNIHTTNPCITLCFRTIDHTKILLNSYYNQGMKIKLHRMSFKDQKRLEALVHLTNISDQAHHAEILFKNFSDHTLYALLIGQYPFFNRSGGKLNQLINEELTKRDEETFRWVRKVLNTQTHLNSEIGSMVKT
jgi:hypothetical protein